MLRTLLARSPLARWTAEPAVRTVCTACCPTSRFGLRPAGVARADLLAPVLVPQRLALVDQARTYKIHSSVKKICDGCQIVVRKGRVRAVDAAAYADRCR